MRILIAPNAFKNSVDANEAALAIEKGLLKANAGIETERLPVGDGGDGTGKLLVRHLGAIMKEVLVKDPLGMEIIASYGWLEHSKTAIIEMADASGLRLLKPSEYNPLKATSYGTGQLIKAAIDNGAKKILLCIGGSATVDGGLGILCALGFKFFNAKGYPIYIAGELHSLSEIQSNGVITSILQTEIKILCDVKNPLLSLNGAARIFGPQKGADKDMIVLLENGLTKLRDSILTSTGKDIANVQHGGAAGGVAAGLFGLLNAELVNGIDEFLTLVQFETSIKKANWVVTGEGSIDLQTLEGKAPVGVATMAKQYYIPVTAFAGKIPDGTNNELSSYFKEIININKGEVSLEYALMHTSKNLEQAAFELGIRLSSDPKK